MRRFLLIVGVAALVGCGSDGNSASDPDRPPQGETFASKAGELCAAAVARERRAERRVARLADRFKGSPAAFGRRIAPEYVRLEKLTQRLFDDLKALERLAPDKKALRAYLAHLGRLATFTNITVESMRGGRLAEERARLNQLQVELERGRPLARRLGIDQCAKLGHPVRPAEAG